MKLITKAIERKLVATPLYSTEDVSVENKRVIVKFFNPCGGGTWYVFEAERTEAPDGSPDWMFFGLVHLFEKELGYFTLSELESVRLPFGLRIERDRHFEGTVPSFDLP